MMPTTLAASIVWAFAVTLASMVAAMLKRGSGWLSEASLKISSQLCSLPSKNLGPPAGRIVIVRFWPWVSLNAGSASSTTGGGGGAFAPVAGCVPCVPAVRHKPARPGREGDREALQDAVIEPAINRHLRLAKHAAAKGGAAQVVEVLLAGEFLRFYGGFQNRHRLPSPSGHSGFYLTAKAVRVPNGEGSRVGQIGVASALRVPLQ